MRIPAIWDSFEAEKETMNSEAAHYNRPEPDKKEAVKEVQRLLAAGGAEAAFSLLTQIADPTDDFVLQSRYAAWWKKMPAEALGLQPVRIAIAASSTVSHFIEVLRFWLARAGLAAEIFAAEYDTIPQTILDPSSALYAFRPDITMIFTNYRDVPYDLAPDSGPAEIERKLKDSVKQAAALWQVLRRQSGCHIIQNNADLPANRVFGNYEVELPASRLHFLRRYNADLAGAAGPGVTIFDLDYLSSIFGKERWHDSRYWHHSKHAFALDATGLVAHRAAQLIAAIRGLAGKCLVLDLDNTLWGGVIADDGLEGIELGSGVNGEAYVEFQQYLLELKRRGIVLAVCSKNEEATARLPFQQHPDMRIRLEDIAVFKANWQNKADNIREIARVLNLGLDSLVFVDDNPAERELVRQYLPMVRVPELGADPAGYIYELDRQAYFETISFSREDTARNDYYRADAGRAEYQRQFSDLSGYLQSLEMRAAVVELDAFNLPRAAQLINKSNQFHLTTTRYTEGQLREKIADPDFCCRCFTLEDKFGSSGLIAAVILQRQGGDTLYIDTWVMSCRVLGRGMEEFVGREIAVLAETLGVRYVLGKYIPTKKNHLVADLYRHLGFDRWGQDGEAALWRLDLTKGRPYYKTCIVKLDRPLAGQVTE